MKQYDLAARNFYQTQQVNSLPLGSWDVFSSKYGTLCKGLEEICNVKAIAKAEKWLDDTFFENEILEKNHIVVITDAELNIVHASETIFSMNGYHPHEIIGKRPKMFQGEKTCQTTAQEIKKAIQNEQPFEATVLNYRKDGSTYNCWIHGMPIKNAKGQLVNFIAFEREVA